jgi:hypothetical protein
MITPGTKWFLGLGVVMLALAALYGWSTGGNALGPLTMGYKGGVGDHFGYGLLMTAALLSLLQGLVLAAVRDADPRAEAEAAGVDVVPVTRPAGASYWPAIAAFGVAVVLVGLVADPLVFIFGCVVLGIVLIEWTVQTWADHATGDPATNRRLRNRFMNPIEFPLAGALAIAVVAISFSRGFLAVSEINAVWFAAGLASAVLLVGTFIATRPRVSSNVVVALLLVAAIAVITLGVVGGVSGEREFHPIVTEQELREELSRPLNPVDETVRVAR